jgi:serine/threonine protein kinase
MELPRQLAVNHFLLLDKLGQGGQGEVYRARQLNPSRFVAVKTLTRDSESSRRRFEQEARAMMRIQHPAVARFHLYERVRDTAGLQTDEYLIAMEFVEGIDLSRLLNASGPVPWSFVARWAIDLLDGLAVIHQNGFIHRDSKPANVMILGPTPDSDASLAATAAKLLDFGAVKPSGDDGGSTGRRRVFVGTREYAAPEQWAERTVPASDLYALGATIFHALTGRPPYEVEGRDAIAFMKAHTRAPIPEVRDFAPEVPEALAELLLRMMAKQPDDRGTAAELGRAFRALVPREPVKPPASRAPSARPSKPAAQPTPPLEAEHRSISHSAIHSVLTLLERIVLPNYLRPPSGEEPSAAERIVIILRRPIVLITLAILLVLLVLWIW